MAHEGYITIKGNKQGQFKGQSTEGNRKGKWTSILSFEYSVQSPRDAASGLPSGKRQHQPIVITAEQGAASPQLLQAAFSNELLRTVLFEFTRPGQNGQETVYHTINLTNAQIVSVVRYVGHLPRAAPPGEKYETITLVYGDQLVTGVSGSLAHVGAVTRLGKWA